MPNESGRSPRVDLLSSDLRSTGSGWPLPGVSAQIAKRRGSVRGIAHLNFAIRSVPRGEPGRGAAAWHAAIYSSLHAEMGALPRQIFRGDNGFDGC